MLEALLITVVVCAMSFIGNYIAWKIPIIDAVPGMIILYIITVAGMAAKYIGDKWPPLRRLPAFAYIALIGTIVSTPWFPGSDIIIAYTGKVAFLALCTPILAYAGISLGKEVGTFKKVGWKIAITACAVFFGTFIGSAIIAQILLKLLGLI
jgi:hypothetical protein